MKKVVFFAPIILLFVCVVGLAENPARVSEEKLVKARPLPLESVRLTAGPLRGALASRSGVPPR